MNKQKLKLKLKETLDFYIYLCIFETILHDAFSKKHNDKYNDDYPIFIRSILYLSKLNIVGSILFSLTCIVPLFIVLFPIVAILQLFITIVVTVGTILYILYLLVSYMFNKLFIK